MELLLCATCSNPTFICDCESKWKTFNNILESCNGKTEDGIMYTSLSISTMTVCFNFNQEINLPLLKEQLPET